MNCAICYGRRIHQVLDLGDMALAGAFVKREDFRDEKVYPLRLGFCESCALLQVLDRAPAQFERYFYRSSTSATARAHFKAYASEVVERFRPSRVLEIGCNDGAMLQPLAELAEKVIGVDPSNAAADIRGVDVWRSYFDERVAKQIGKVDLVLANNVMAHVENLHQVAKGIRWILNPGGALVMECHYLGSVLAGQYDAIYHEHLFYHSLVSLERFFRMWGMEVFDVQPSSLHAGSMRYFVGRAGEHAVEPAVARLRDEELLKGFGEEATYRALAVKMLEHRRSLCELLRRLQRERATVIGYGAAGRANTLLQWCGIERINFVVDDCREKWGFYTPGTHIQILSPAEFAESWHYVDYVLVTAWSYLDEIAPKCHGIPLIVPFPEPRIVRAEVREAA